MNDHPLQAAQAAFQNALNTRTNSETIPLADALGRVLAVDITAQEDAPPYPRVIAEGFLVNTAETQAASEDNPVSFSAIGSVQPGDANCPAIPAGKALNVVTGSLVDDRAVSVIRMWDGKITGDTVTITRPFPPRFFIEEQGCDINKGSVILDRGTRLSTLDIGTLASLGLNTLTVAVRPRVSLFSIGNEVIPYDQPLNPGMIRDSNALMLAAAITEAGGIPIFGGILADDADQVRAALQQAISESDMVLVSGGTAVAGRDFTAERLAEVGECLLNGVKMRSGKPLVMGRAKDGTPLVCVAGHPPEALRGFQLFGSLAINAMTGQKAALPEDPQNGQQAG